MVSLYDMSVPIFLRALHNSQEILRVAEKHCEDKSLSPATLVEARLAPDMHPLTFQIQTISNSAKLAAVRVAGVPNEPWDDNETTFAQLHERIEKTIKFLEAAKREDFEGKEGAEVVMKTGGGNEFKFTGLSYLQNFALP
ncbi:hypothetical protein LTR53_014129 [Teratosphaeriaceae sp. CCFEE 6253]|nr:hypothetical protein LTR53_002981 [Teratosphaeriaceae sp. CCFEE 6253]KAK3111017.1 hypothetical protein LTR53_014129 [Teratosphaeriaceae sp. CCFEE 6253]